MSREHRPEDRDHVELPPPDAPPDDPEIVTLDAGTAIARIFNPEPHGYTTLSFRHWGPSLRWDHQRGSVTEPAVDADRGVWYGALVDQPEGTEGALETCLRECFQKFRRYDLSAHLARVRVLEGDTLRLLSLLDDDPPRAGAVAQMPWCTDARKPQAWSRYFYATNEVFGDLDGLLYRSMYNGALNVALYERASRALERHPAHESIRLEHQAVLPAVAAFVAPLRWSQATGEL